MNTAIRLSVCIPTYNFGAFIGEALASVLHDIPPRVEVVVLDSGSTDQTQSVIEALLPNHRCLRYVRVNERHGIDRDMAHVVELAHGDYCWLFSADDVMVEGALARVLAELERADDVFLCMHTNETISMQPIHASHPVLASDQNESFQLGSTEEQLRYFGLALTTEAFFSFMGGIIVRKGAWGRVPLNEQFVGSCWAHVARLFELMGGGLSVRFLPWVLLRRRGDNDSFSTHGVVRRYALAINGYQRLSAYFWGERSPQAFHIRRVLRNEFRLRTFWGAKAQCMVRPDVEDIRILSQLVDKTYSDANLRCLSKRIGFRLLPAMMFIPTRALHQAVMAVVRRPPAPTAS